MGIKAKILKELQKKPRRLKELKAKLGNDKKVARAVDELVEELNRLGREVIFLGDGVPVYREQILQKLTVPCSFAPAANNRQRAASVASLGAVYYAHGRTVTAAEHEPEYLRKSQAEREREEQEKAAKEARA